MLRFENGASADITFSRIDMLGKPLWRILGTKGAILDKGVNAINGYGGVTDVPESAGSLELTVLEDGKKVTKTVAYKKSAWERYYPAIARHLKDGEPLPVPTVEGRRVIAILNAAEKSANSGKTEPVEYEFD